MRRYPIFILLILMGCTKPEPPTLEEVPEENPINPVVQKFVKTKFSSNRVPSVGDSLVIQSLDVTLYHMRFSGTSDSPRYTLIRDHQTNIIYSVILPGWASGFDPPCDIQLTILRQDSRIKPINNLFYGLESFLNQSDVVNKKGITMDALDSIVLFWWPEMSSKLSADKVENILHSTLTDKEYYPTMSKKWVTEMKALLKEKMKKKNVLVYPAGAFFYFELVDGDVGNQGLRQGNRFDLIAFRVGRLDCPD